MKNKLLISLHLPKTGGNSFLKTLNISFGEGLLQDYSDMLLIQRYLGGSVGAHEINNYQQMEPDWFRYQCIHGHFMPAKYVAFKDQYPMAFITWLREPVDRLVSHFNFFRRSYDSATAGPLFRKIIEENWSLEQFLFCEEYRNIYSKYFVDFPFELFDFIGITELYSEDLAFFSNRYLGKESNAYRLNSAVDNQISSYDVDKGLRREVEQFHSEDVNLYSRVLQERQRRV